MNQIDAMKSARLLIEGTAFTLHTLPSGQACICSQCDFVRGKVAVLDELRQAIEQADKQEPVMIYHGGCTIDCGEHGHHNMEMLKLIPAGSKLYTHPPTAQEVHDALCSALTGGKCSCSSSLATVDKAWSQFCGGIGRGADAPYPGMIQAFEAHYGQSFTDKDWRNETGIWAAAWGYAVRRCNATPTAPEAPAQPLTDEQIEKGRKQTFSVNNPYCPCDSKTMRKAVRWAEFAHGIKGETK
jgi:hypothetical protein